MEVEMTTVDQLKAVEERLSILTNAINKKDLLLNKIENNNNNMIQEQQRIDELLATEMMAIDRNPLNEAHTALLNEKTTYDNALKEYEMYDILMELLSAENLKGHILDQQIPFLNRNINMFIEMFSNDGINLVIDNEFNETLITRVGVHEFNSLSNGQKQRITFSILFAFLKLIEERSGISTNILILDEYLDSSLDAEGTEEVMQIIYDIFAKTKDVILITHDDKIKSKESLISRFITVEREDEFSSMNFQ